MMAPHFIRPALIVPTLVVMVVSAHAQDVEFSTSPSPVGSGARAAGMANAFIAIADDATAASWNPAGLIQLELPEMSLVYAFNRINESLLADSRIPEVEDTFGESSSQLNFASIVYPFTIGDRNLSASLTYQRKYDFNRMSGLTLDDAVPGISRELRGDFDQSGGFGTITPSLAVEITPTLSVGASLHLWRSNLLGQNDFDVDTVIRDKQVFATFPTLNQDLTFTTHEQYDDFSGESFVLGVLWNVAPKWNLALRVDSGFTGDIDYTLNQVTFDNLAGSVAGTALIDENREITLPWTYSVGAAWRVNDKLTLSFDASFTDYDDFYIELEDGTEVSLVDGHDRDDPVTKTKFDLTQTYRFGWEYVMIPTNLDSDLDRLWTVRGGLFYEEEPASNRDKSNPNSRGDGEPDRFFGVAGGVGLLVKQRINFDAAYQFRWGNGVRSDTIGGIGLPGFEEDIRQHRLVLSTVIYLGGWGRSQKDERDYEQARAN